MPYTVEFDPLPRDNGEPYMALYEQFIPEIVGRPVTESGAVQAIHCVNVANHAHGDRNPSAFVNLRSGVYGCSVCGNYSIIRFLEEIIGYKKSEAVEVKRNYDKDRGFPKEAKWPKAPILPSDVLTRFAQECQSNISDALSIVRDYCTARGITYETLRRFGVGYLPETEVQREPCLTIPYYVNGKVVTIRGRTIDGRKGAIKGSRNTLLGLDNVVGPVALLVEGESDCLRLQQFCWQRDLPVSVISTPGAAVQFEWRRDLAELEQVVLVPQEDVAAQRWVDDLTRMLPRTIKIQRLPWKRGELGKDICDWLLQHSDEELVKVIPWERREKIVRSTFDMLTEAKKPIPWLVEGMLARGDKAILTAPQKSMKTYMTLFLAAAVSRAEPVWGAQEWQVKQGIKTLFVEEEGNLITFAKRVERVVGPLKDDNIRWLHKHSIKLDAPESYQALIDIIEREKPDLLILDPLQRMHNQNEDSSTEMAIVWDALHQFTVKYPNMAVLVLHHAKKGDQPLSWDSMRGSSRTAGEVDVGIFLRKLGLDKDTGHTRLRVRLEGRDIPPLIRGEEGSVDDEFEVRIDTKNWTVVTEQFKVTVRKSGNSVSNSERILEVLPATNKELCQLLALDPSQVSRLTAALLEKGLVIEKMEGRRKVWHKIEK